jgi:hypothetical protein
MTPAGLSLTNTSKHSSDLYLLAVSHVDDVSCENKFKNILSLC